MGAWFSSYYPRKRARRCTRAVRWSMTKGGCRLEPGHVGECKAEGKHRF